MAKMTEEELKRFLEKVKPASAERLSEAAMQAEVIKRAGRKDAEERRRWQQEDEKKWQNRGRK